MTELKRDDVVKFAQEEAPENTGEVIIVDILPNGRYLVQAVDLPNACGVWEFIATWRELSH